MDDFIKQLEESTCRIRDQLDTLNYEQLTEFVENRESLVSGIVTKQAGKHLTPESRNRIERLLKHDEAILKKMQEFRQEAAESLVKAQNAKRQSSGYQDILISESVFFDKRK